VHLLMFGSFAANGIRYSRHHLTAGLARRHRVWIVDEPPHWRAVAKCPARLFGGAQVVMTGEGVSCYQSPGWLPQVYRPSHIRRMLYRARARELTRTIGPQAARSIAYVWTPEYQEAVEPLGQMPIVYHCYDKYDRYIGVPKDAQRETWLARKAVLCIAASSMLGEHLQTLGARRVHVLRHGVDIEMFRPGLEPPAALAAIPRPRLGLVAKLNEVLDVETLEHLALQKPEWSLVLVGGTFYTDPARAARFEALCRLPNVFHVGAQPAAVVPQWLAGFDVGLICYDPDTWGPYNQPIKLYEYLACGLPVVSTDIRAARELGDLVEVCGCRNDWVPALERALASRSPAAIEGRLDYARANTWEKRVKDLEGALEAVGQLT